MRKSTLFISAVLTTFVMAMLAGVASAYQNAVEAAQQEIAQPQTKPQVKAISHTMSADSQFTVSPEEAAGLAAQVLGREDLFSVEVTDLDGETVFLVTFSSGDLVYVSLDGQIRSIGKVQVNTVVVKSGGGGGDGGGGNVQPPPAKQSHEDHKDDDHEEDHKEEDHEDHDDD